MMVTVYELADIRVELAKRTGKRGDYSRQRILELIKKHLPMVKKTGGQYFLTDAELDELAGRVQVQRRPRKY
jgi:hypothetical protein